MRSKYNYFQCFSLFFFFFFKFNYFYDWYIFNCFFFVRPKLWSNSSEYIHQIYFVDLQDPSWFIPDRGLKLLDNYVAFLDRLEGDAMNFNPYDDHHQTRSLMIFVGTYVGLSAIIWWFIATCQRGWWCSMAKFRLFCYTLYLIPRGSIVGDTLAFRIEFHFLIL